MSQRRIDRITSVIGSLLMAVFVIGLAEGITAGFAGFWGGLPFWIIVIFVLLMVGYDCWDSCFAKKETINGPQESRKTS